MSNFTIKSPIDGYVEKIPLLGSRSKGAHELPISLSYYKSIKNSMDRGTSKINAITKQPETLVEIRPWNLEISREIEQNKLKGLETRLRIAKKRLEKELHLNSRTLSHALGKRLHLTHLAEASKHEGISHEGKMTAERGEELFKEWRDFSIKFSLPEEIKAAELEIRTIEMSLALLDANRLLGHISIPFECTIDHVHVHENQFVNKGDEILSIAKT